MSLNIFHNAQFQLAPALPSYFTLQNELTVRLNSVQHMYIFIISFTFQSWCAISRLARSLLMLKLDVHSPPKYRYGKIKKNLFAMLNNSTLVMPCSMILSFYSVR